MISRKRLGIFLTFLGALIVIIHLQFLNPEWLYIRWMGTALFFIGPFLVPDYEKKPKADNN
ncbi:hypothetical protein [Peribacillus acanthi]|uniref:hypothetical protein n=1 Tax=Peribacillus acanthi TaxID=2171554 RepID=UPI000D3E805C|nr:hypothetical protein [Peribacillus acanthi]